MAKETVAQDPEFMFAPNFRARPEVDRALLPGSAVMAFLNRTQNITYGAAAVLELIDWSEALPDSGGTALLNGHHKSLITRLAMEAMVMLGDEAEKIQEWAYHHHTPEGRAERANR